MDDFVIGIIIILFITIILSGYFSHMSLKNLSEYGQNHKIKVSLMGMFAGPKYYNEKGWKYAFISIIIGLLGIIIFFLYGVLCC